MKEIFGRYNIIWEGALRPNEAELAQVVEELEELAEQLESPDKLMFHTVILDKIDSGPAVVVTGKDGDHSNFYAVYYTEIEWETLPQIEE